MEGASREQVVSLDTKINGQWTAPNQPAYRRYEVNRDFSEVKAGGGGGGWQGTGSITRHQD